MPNGKRKKQPISQSVKRISITEREFLEKMAHRMHPPILSDLQTNEIRLLKKKEVDNFLSIPELARNFFHRESHIKPDCYARGIVASWTCMQTVFMNAFRLFEKTKLHFEDVKTYYNWLNQNYQITHNFFIEFLKNPKDPKLNSDTRRLLHGVIGRMATSLATYPLYYAVALYEQNKTITGELRSIHEQCANQIKAMHLIIDEVAPKLIEFEAQLFCPLKDRSHLLESGSKIQVHQMKTLSTSVLSLLSSVINPSECLTDSPTHNPVKLYELLQDHPNYLKLMESDQKIRSIIENNPLIGEISGPSSSTDMPPQRSLLLTTSTNPLIIRAEWKKLFNLISAKDQDPSILSTDIVSEWVTNPIHLSFYFSSIREYAKKLNYDQDQDRCMIVKSHTLPLERVKQIIANQRLFLQIGLFVFDRVQNSNNQAVKDTMLYPLALAIYEVKSPFIGLIHIADDLKNGNAQWFTDNMYFFGMAFETIQPLLMKMGLSFILNQKIPGLASEIYDYNQSNLASFFQVILQLYHHQILNQVMRGNLNEAKALRHYLNQLSTLIKKNITHILDSSKYSPDSIKESLVKMLSLVEYSQGLNKIESEPGIEFLIALKQIEIPLDNNLVTVHSRKNLSPLTLSRFFEKLKAIVADSPTLTDAFPILQDEFLDLVISCFGADKEYNIINAKHLILIFSFLSNHLSEDYLIDLCLIKTIKLLSEKTYQALNLWNDQLIHEKKPLLLKLETTLRDDIKNQRTYNTSLAKKEFQTYFSEPGFIMALENYFKDRKSQLSIPTVGILIQLTSNIDFSVRLHAELVGHFYTEILKDFTILSFAEACYYFEVINECLPLLIGYSQKIFDKNAIGSFYLTIIYLKCSESRFYFYHGFPEKALDILAEASCITESCSTLMNQESFERCQQKLLDLKKEIDNPASPPNLLAFMRNPEAAATISLDPTDSAPDSIDLNEDLTHRFHRAYHFLILSPNQQNSKRLYQTWKSFFNKMDMPPATKELLLSHWDRHYTKCREIHLASNQSQSKANNQATKTKPTKSSTTRAKIDWSQITEERRLQKISMFNETRTQILAKRREQKQAQKRAQQDLLLLNKASSSEETATNNNEVDVSNICSTETKRLSIPDGVLDIMSTIKKHGYEVYIVGGFVRDQLLGLAANDVDLFTNCPASVLETLVTNLIPNNKFKDVFYLYLQTEELAMDIKSVAFESMHDLVNHFDFTINAFILDCEGQVHAPLPQSFTDLDNKQIKPIKAGLETFIEDNSRIWRLIRLANQLNWELAKEEKDLIKTLGSRLCDLPFSQFYTQFNRCFTKNIQEGLKNFNSFQELGLFHHLLMTDAQKPLNNSDFCLIKYEELFNKNPDYRFIDTLALFFILAKESSLRGYQNNITQWIQHFEARDHNPGIIASLKKELPLRVAHYNRLRIYNVNATPYNPYETPASHMILGFMNNHKPEPASSSELGLN